MIADALPVLHVILPLCGAALCAMTKQGRASAWLAIAASWGSFACVLALIWFYDGPISYALGGWEPPIGIEYRVDRLTLLMLAVVSGAGAVTLPYAARAMRPFLAAKQYPLFYTLFLLCLAGLLGIVSTNDIFNIYVFLEISSLAACALMALGSDRRALKAAFDYLILGTIGATFYLTGVGLLYFMYGTLNLSDMAARLMDARDLRPVLAGFAFILAGLALKMGLFPLHSWMVNGYSHAPPAVAAFLSAAAAKASFYVLARLVASFWGARFAYTSLPLADIITVLALAGIIAGSVMALRQDSVTRLLAYSSVAQISYLVLGFALATEAGLAGSLAYLPAHALAKAGMFMAAGAVMLRTGGVSLAHFRRACSMKWTMSAFLLCGLSLIGIPGTAGFIGKWALLTAMLAAEAWVSLAALLLGSLLAALYVWRVVEAAWFGGAAARKLKEAPLVMLIPMWICALLGLVSGLWTDITLGTALKTAHELMGTP